MTEQTQETKWRPWKRIEIPPRPEPAPPVEPKLGKTPLGFVENALDSSWRMLKGIAKGVFVDMPVANYQAVRDIWKYKSALPDIVRPSVEYDEATKTWVPARSMLAQQLGSTARAVADSLVEPYRKHGWDIWYYDPAQPLMDAFTIATLGGGSVAKLGRLTGMAKLERTGKMIESIPSRIWEKSATGAFKAVGIDRAKRAEVLAMKSDEVAKARIESHLTKKAMPNALGKLDDAEKARLDKILVQGGTAAELSEFPKVQAAWNEYRGWVKGTREKYIAESGLSAAGGFDEAVAKKYASEVFRSTKAEDVLRARQAIVELEVKPVYTPAVLEHRVPWTIDDVLESPAVIRTGKVPFLERFTGGGGRIKDPGEYIGKSIDAFYRMKAKTDWVKRIEARPEMVTGVARAGEIPVAQKLPSQGVFSKYFADEARVKAVLFRDLAKEHGVSKAVDMLRGDDFTRRRFNAISGVVVDPTISRILKMEFRDIGGVPGMIVHAYDKVLNLFKAAATKFNPKWYSGNVVGDAFLYLLAGGSLSDLRASSKIIAAWKKSGKGIEELKVPFQVASVGTLATDIGSMAKVNKLTEWVQEWDNVGRAGLLKGDVRDRLYRTGAAFFDMEDDVRRIVAAPPKYAEAQLAIQTANEHIVRRVPKLQALDRGISVQEAKLARSQQAHAELVGQQGMATTPRQIQIAQRLRDLDAKMEALAKGSEAVGALQVAARGEIKGLIRKGRGGIEKGLMKTLLADEASSRAYHVEILRDIRQRGGINPGELASDVAYSDLPKSYFRKGGVPLDQLAQEFSDRGIIAVADSGDLLDFLSKTYKAAAKKPVNPKMVRAEARKILATRSDASIGELIRTAREQVNLRREFLQARVASRQAQKQAVEIASKRNERVAVIQKEIEATKARLGHATQLRDQILADIRDRTVRRGEFEKLMPGLEKDMAVARPAIEKANGFFGDYDGLGPVEQYLFRRMVPFYAFSKAMAMLAFRLPFRQPGQLFRWDRYAAFMASQVGDPGMPEYMASYIPTFVLQDGSTAWMKMSSVSPFGSLRTSRFGGIPIPGIVDIREQNPIARLLYTMSGGKTKFDVGTIPYGEPMVSVADGSVYEMTGDGYIQKTIPQVPFIAGLIHMFPGTQFIDQLITGSEVNQYGDLGEPHAIMNPDGSVRYPVELWNSLTNFFVARTKIKKREDIILAEKRRVRMVMEDLRAEYRRADPERRQFIQQVFRDYAAGAYRKIKAE